MSEVIVRYFHFVGIFILAASLFAEHLLVKPRITTAELKRLAVIDAIFGASAAVVFLAGLSLWLWVGKPAAFYSGNIIFHAKLTIFIVIALLSIYPTVFFIKHRALAVDNIVIPRKIILLIRLELVLLLIIPLLAVLMARGYGL